MSHPDIRSRGFELWPNLQKILNNFKDGRSSPLSKPCPEFVVALSSVLSVLDLSYVSSSFLLSCYILLSTDFNLSWANKGANIKEFVRVCEDIFDRSLLGTLSPTSAVWKVAGANELPHLHIDPNGGVRLSPSIPIETLPQYTGLSIATISQILKENRGLFDFAIIFTQHSFYINCMRNSYHKFLMDEVRSGDLHVTYRNSVIRALKSRITYIKNLQSVEACVAFSTRRFMVDAVTHYPWYRLDRVGSIFLSFCRRGWNIRTDIDLQEGSAMCEVLDLLLDCRPILPHSLMSNSPLSTDSAANTATP